VHHIKVAPCLLASNAGLMLATAGSASAASPVTFTDVSTFSDHFTGPDFACQDELYDVGATRPHPAALRLLPGHRCFHGHFSDTAPWSLFLSTAPGRPTPATSGTLIRIHQGREAR
jgi:hypothetical protein